MQHYLGRCYEVFTKLVIICSPVTIEKKNQYYLNVYRVQAKENLNLSTVRKPLDSSCSEAVYLPRSRLEELAWQGNFPSRVNR